MAEASYTRSVTMGDNNANCGNTIGSFNKTINKTINISDEDAPILQWLSPLEPRNRHQGVRTDRFDGVGDWLLESNEFREWRTRRSDGGADGGTDEAILFCSGNPGVGKTYLSSLVIDSLCNQAGSEDIAVACLYCDFLVQQDQTITNMMGAILKQLLGRRGIPEDIREEYQKGKTEIGGRGLRLPDLVGMLKTTIASLPQAFICIDALDESLPKHLPELLELLRDIVRESPTRIFLTGRPHIGEDIRRCFTKAVVIPISPNNDDIRSYLEMRLDRDPDPEAMNDDLRADIMRVIPEKISDIFLLVSPNIDAILGEMTLRQRRKKLEEMKKGNGLSDAYTATLTRVKAQKGNKSILGLKALMWVSHSERPLLVGDLCHALGVEIGSTDQDVENIPSIRTILASSLGLITVEASSSTVRLVHFTLQEHLSDNPILFPSPHSSIAEVCLTYLNFQCIRDLSPTLCSDPSTIPLLDYASRHWAKHTGKEMTESVKRLALRLLDGFEEHISAQLVTWSYEQEISWFQWSYGEGKRVKGFTGLHAAAFFGIVEIVDAVLSRKEWDVNAMDSTGSMALSWAARRGYEGALKLLLAREDVNPNTSGTEFGQTPLGWAAENGHDAVVKTLLAQEDINPNISDSDFGLKPLCLAAMAGHDAVVKTLLAREDVNPNTPDTEFGQTPLVWAAENGYDAVVKTLLAREDVNPNMPDSRFGRVPLYWAAEESHDAVVKTLLAREDVNPNMPDSIFGQTPLCCAARDGNDAVVKTLLAREDVNPNTADTRYGRTPLLWAAKNGHAEVVKRILERVDIHIGTSDNEHETPLTSAFSNGHFEVVIMLQERIDSSSETADDGGHALSSLSAGQECAVVMQSGSGDLDPEITDLDRQNANSSGDPDEKERILDFKNAGSSSGESHPPSTEHSGPPPPSPECSLSSSPRKTDTSPHDSGPTIPIAINRYLMISSFVCLFAFLLYLLPSLLPTISPFHK